jgi:hypothetical protein
MEKKISFPDVSPNHVADREIESLLSHSMTLFKITGMPDLANKWETILENYKDRINHRTGFVERKQI